MNKRAALAGSFVMIALAVLSCKNPQTNSNQKNANQAVAAQKTARWVAQFRSPLSQKFEGVNLAYFSYASISVVSPTVVFVAGDMPHPKNPQDERIAVIIHTTDGGQSWKETPIEQPGMNVRTLNSIHFVDRNLGWAAGAESPLSGVILKTTDGGATWSASRIKFKQTPTSVFFIDSERGWMSGATSSPDEEEEGGPSDILATTDGGNTWHAQRRVPVTITDIFFLDKMTGWAGGHKGAIYHTTDGGATWNTQRSELEPGDGPIDPNSEGAKLFAISGIHFTDAQNGFAAANSTEEKQGRVLGTTNGGSVWSRRWIVGNEGVSYVYFVSPLEGWAVTNYDRYVYHTVDGGRYWFSEPIEFEQDAPFFEIGAADASHVWAVGGGAIFYRVAD